MRLIRPPSPERLGHDLEIVKDLRHIARSCGFTLWVDDGQLSVRSGLEGAPERLFCGEAAQLVILWRLARRAGAILDASCPAKKPAARASAASQKSRRQA